MLRGLSASAAMTFDSSVVLPSHFWNASEICAGLGHTCWSFEIGSQSSEELRTKRGHPENERNYLMFYFSICDMCVFISVCEWVCVCADAHVYIGT